MSEKRGRVENKTHARIDTLVGLDLMELQYVMNRDEFWKDTQRAEPDDNMTKYRVKQKSGWTKIMIFLFYLSQPILHAIRIQASRL